jgi:hypothetical protein
VLCSGIIGDNFFFPLYGLIVVAAMKKVKKKKFVLNIYSDSSQIGTVSFSGIPVFFFFSKNVNCILKIRFGLDFEAKCKNYW